MPDHLLRNVARKLTRQAAHHDEAMKALRRNMLTQHRSQASSRRTSRNAKSENNNPYSFPYHAVEAYSVTPPILTSPDTPPPASAFPSSAYTYTTPSPSPHPPVYYSFEPVSSTTPVSVFTPTFIPASSTSTESEPDADTESAESRFDGLGVLFRSTTKAPWSKPQQRPVSNSNYLLTPRPPSITFSSPSVVTPPQPTFSSAGDYSAPTSNGLEDSGRPSIYREQVSSAYHRGNVQQQQLQV
jgi:hypothetical protein